jgi:hypothetical protein
MIVRPICDLIKSAGFSSPTKVLTKEKIYYVYALKVSALHKKTYYILDDTDSSLPIEYEASLFKIIDNSLPKEWVTVYNGIGYFKKKFSSFPEWAQDLGNKNKPGFYERLVDGDPGNMEERIFAKYYKIANDRLNKS